MFRSLLLPAAVGGLVIFGLCFFEQVFLRDYWSKPGVEAELMGQRFAQVPKEIGPWKGQDLSVDAQVKNTAGAVNYVSRLYKNEETGREVKLWLIVGHSRDICRHTPNICYPSSGFRQEGRLIPFEVPLNGTEPGKFFTGKFIKDDAYGKHAERVFWAWSHPDIERFGAKWEAPSDARQHYGLSRALYKMYFTSNVMSDEDTASDNVAAEFAAMMLPEVNKALFPETAAAAATSADEAESDETDVIEVVQEVDSTEEAAAEAEEPAAE